MTKKWRYLIVYAVIFVALATYFFVFEVHKKRKETEAKEAERKVFSMNPDEIGEITILRNSGKIVLVKEGDQWRITSPLETETDRPSVLGFVNTLASLRAKKWIGHEGDLSAFGLKNPTITISAKVNQKEHRLLIGDKTPIGDGVYAMAFVDNAPVGKEPVFVIDTGVWGVLKKELYDLRKKELASFEDPQVKSIEIRWHGDKENQITIVREAQGWKLQDNPDIKVKKSRVDHIVDQIRWLRAIKFVGDSKVDPESYKPGNPIVTISLDLSNRNPLKIKFGNYVEQKQEGEAQKEPGSSVPRLEAVSSDLPFVAVVDRYILNELPHKPDDLLDRSLMTWKEDDIGKIVWRRGNDTMEFVKEGDRDSHWKWKKGSDKGYNKLSEGWKVRSVIWAANDIEYETKKEPVKSLPDKIGESVQFYDTGGKLLAELAWQEVSANQKDSSTVWVKSGDTDMIQVFTVQSSKLKNLSDRLKSLDTSQDKKS